jgi:hypothetical protein
MKELFLPLLVVLTSLAGYLIGVRSGRTRRGLRAALGRTLELAGLTVVFLVANLALGLAVVLTMRALSMPFVSVYLLDDIALVAVSSIQGVIFGWWRWLTPGPPAGGFADRDD